MVRIYEPMVSATPEEIVAEQRKEISRIGTVRRLPGLKLYEYDLTTGEIREADVETEAALKLYGPVGKTGRVEAKELCLYVQALNRQNAIRKFYEMTRRKSVQKKILKKH